MFESVRALFQPPTPAVKVITVSSSVNYAELPQGFFQVETASGKKSLGYNCPAFLCWEVGPTVVVGRDRITLSVSPEELPLVKLNFRQQTDGVQQLGSVGILDTDNIDHDGSVTWAGAVPRGGVEFI